ncbi:MAG: DNA-directed RNA polymerase subunit omega [Acidobacteriales bacterium]|nr:DNA-directed RNA polymerase subunit omega [Terriglobales bacterium]
MPSESKYREILIAAKRARQLEGGAPKLVESRSRKACKIALEEIRAGKIEYTTTAPKGENGQ